MSISHLGFQGESEHELSHGLEETHGRLGLGLPEPCHRQYGATAAPQHFPVHQARAYDGGLLVPTRVHQHHLPIPQVQRQPHHVLLTSGSLGRPHPKRLGSDGRCHAGRSGCGLGSVHPLEPDDAYPWKHLSGRDKRTSVDGVQFDQLPYAASHHDARVIGAPRGTQEAGWLGVAGWAGHEGAEVELSDPDPAPVGCAHEDVAVRVGDEDLVPIVAPLEVADGGPPVVHQLHDGPTVVIPPHDDSARGITCGYLVQVFVPANNGYLSMRSVGTKNKMIT